MKKYQKKKLMAWQPVLYLVAKMKIAFILADLDKDNSTSLFWASRKLILNRKETFI